MMNVTIDVRLTFKVPEKFEAQLARENGVVRVRGWKLLDLYLTERGEWGMPRRDTELSHLAVKIEEGDVTIETRGFEFSQNGLAAALARKK